MQADQLGGPRPAQEPAGAQDRRDRSDGLVGRGRLARAVRDRGNTRRARARARAVQPQDCDGTFFKFAVLVY
jgi:hypothetical protein